MLTKQLLNKRVISPKPITISSIFHQSVDRKTPSNANRIKASSKKINNFKIAVSPLSSPENAHNKILNLKSNLTWNVTTISEFNKISVK